MAKKMLINVMHPEESRVAIVEDGKLVDLDIEIEGSEQTRGNVYKGVVVRVEPGLQAAFVDIGLKRLGFLQMGEIHPSFWQWRSDIPEESRSRRPRIQEVIRRGQELIVQVEKGERDMKGAALTTYMSFPGRYMVLMPGSDSAGISRKVESESDRKKLKEKVAELEIPEGYGYIVRTEALGKTKTELAKDLQYLVKLHQGIVDKAAAAKGPTLLHRELDVVIRTIRDYFTAEIDEVLVDSKDVYKQAREFFKQTMPKFEKLVKLHTEKRPIFSRYQIEEQIDLIYEKKVPLKSGGYLIIEPTEALVSIDVNSGKTTGEKGVEDTAYKTNLEAAEEAARQLRMRDLGGLIVLDFIDMRDKKHITAVEKTLKAALKGDKARVTVGRISQFGMLEMSRQRIRQTLEQGSTLECPHCSGRGKVKSVENMALSFLRKVHAAAAKGTVAEVHGGLPLEVAYYLLNRKKRELAQIENEYDIVVTVKGKTSFLMNQLELELVRREKPAHVETHEEHAEKVAEALAEGLPEAAEGTDVPAEASTAETEGKKKKRRRSRRKGKAEAEEMVESVAAAEIEEPEELEAGGGEEPEAAAGEETAEGEAPGEEARKKRRRKRRRGKKAKADETAAEEASAPEIAEEPAEEETTEAPIPAEEAGEASEEVKKKRRRRKRRTPKRAGEATEAPATEVEPAEPRAAEPEPELAPAEASPESAEPAPKKTRAPRSRKKAAEKPEKTEPAVALPEEQQAPAAAEATPVTPAEAKPAKKRATRKKTTSEPAPAPVQPPVPEPAADEPPKKKRAPRKKKEAPTEGTPEAG
ncbi:Rne/Rng family ribonuclease [Geobacter sulfurreducens]|jgi:ribonuclease E|uniref:Ribonuclease G n=1 Tax=Geobacter sulfurreducens (strain ATCC 51573 / DSM 12127 / PCA) TaxID=243231 RepID=Q74EP1_GEOSL|nr:Rne/Rng family ribonuclease [Geobacter sulfurreducens]AAR34248.1 ribonuclease, Rne/Rng family [Geobacter sulfurreducens PCA]AJY70661.1 ribonuclease E [Geobacter sulfurreducens]QVW36166.1 Rne/Rng family ribonuclease [Geobacter sulfurreducens]UAC04979.1 Rne/Rng family ribonuclease [Geobacter sulfurreducens]UTG93605.1 Rne/Rng family ribonuclease [Geobacter sulfurreducens]